MGKSPFQSRTSGTRTGRIRRGLLPALLALAAVTALADGEWPTATPESQGLSSAVLAGFHDRIAAGEFGEVHSLLVVRHGYLVNEAYFRNWGGDDLHPAFSVTKSVTSALVGIARGRNEMPELDTTVRSLLPEYGFVANPSAAKNAITLDDVLTMRAGLQWDEFGYDYTDPRNPVIEMHASLDWLKFVLDLPMAWWPGTHYNYSTGYTILLAGVLRNTTGMEASEYAAFHLFGPLGIGAWDWNHSPRGLTDTGGGLSLRPRDLAKFGQLFLQQGLWRGTPVVPADWVALSTQPHIDLGGGWGYGYQWRRMPGSPEDNSSFPFAWGWGGQFVFVVPAVDMVVVSTAGNYQNQAGGALSFIRNLLQDAPLTPDGDLDGDGAADSLDLQILWQVLADNVAEGEPPCVAPGLGDLDGDGRLDLADGMILQSRFVGGR
jgi:CubicO group peptidase (beta-lactamase class C family)